MKRKINDFFSPISKKPNIVSHILQPRDQNLPDAVIKREPKDDKFVIHNEIVSKAFIKKENDSDSILKTESSSPIKKSFVKPSSQDTRVLRSLGKNKLTSPVFDPQTRGMGLSLMHWATTPTTLNF